MPLSILIVIDRQANVPAADTQSNVLMGRDVAMVEVKITTTLFHEVRLSVMLKDILSSFV